MGGAWRVFAIFALGHFLSYFFRIANAVIADDLSRDLVLDAAQLGLMSSVFFAGFALAQLPLGSALDRFGGRSVTAAVMLVGVTGALVFAGAPTFIPLAAGRALLGLGTAASLMGALKVLSGWFPARRFAGVAGTLVAIGSSGSLLAAAPLAWMNAAFGWRAVFVGGGLAFLTCAGLIVLFGRDGPDAQRATPAGQPARGSGGFGRIFRDPRFWRLAPLGFAMSGSVNAFQGLWAGPYLTDGLGLGPLQAGNVLSALALGVVPGFLVSGWIAERFGLSRVLTLAAGLFVAVQLALGLRPQSVPLLSAMFAAFGFLASFALLLLAQARAIFPLDLTGRAVTAVNLFFFGGGFVLQWALGLMIARFPLAPTGSYPPEAYGLAFFVAAGLTALALLLYLPFLRADDPAS